MANDVFTLNAGSSSLKFSLWEAGTGTELRELFRGEIDKIGIAPHLSAREPAGRTLIDKRFEEGGTNLSMRTFCASSLPGFRTSAGTALRRLAIASCTAALCSRRRSALTVT